MTLQLRGDTPTIPEFAIVSANGHTAIYKRDSLHQDWHLVTVEKGSADGIVTTLEATGADLRRLDDMLHLLVDGTFPQSLPSFAAPTAVSVLRAEAALIRKKAASAREDAAYGGEYHDGGASNMEKVADAYDHAIDVFERFGHVDRLAG